jgi:glucokinase
MSEVCRKDQVVAAIDVGGTVIKAAAGDRDGRLHHRLKCPTPRTGGADAVVTAVAEIVAQLRVAADVRAVGLVVPGIVRERDGVAALSANLGWRDVPVRDLVSRRVGLPVAFGHDVRAGALAETRLGAACGHRHVAFVPVGTGIAAGLILNGRVYAGTGASGEMGHLVVDPDGRHCGCGRRGCLETVASASAIARCYRERTGRAASGAAEVAEAVRAGDPVAREVWDEAMSALGAALATMTTLFAPEVIVLGGGLAAAGDLALDPIRSRLSARLAFEAVPEVLPAALGAEAGCVGAGLLAFDLLAAARS